MEYNFKKMENAVLKVCGLRSCDRARCTSLARPRARRRSSADADLTTVIEAEKMLHLRKYLTLIVMLTLTLVVRSQLRSPRCETASSPSRSGDYFLGYMHSWHVSLRPEIYVATCNRTYVTTALQSMKVVFTDGIYHICKARDVVRHKNIHVAKYKYGRRYTCHIIARHESFNVLNDIKKSLVANIPKIKLDRISQPMYCKTSSQNNENAQEIIMNLKSSNSTEINNGNHVIGGNDNIVSNVINDESTIVTENNTVHVSDHTECMYGQNKTENFLTQEPMELTTETECHITSDNIESANKENTQEIIMNLKSSNSTEINNENHVIGGNDNIVSNVINDKSTIVTENNTVHVSDHTECIYGQNETENFLTQEPMELTTETECHITTDNIESANKDTVQTISKNLPQWSWVGNTLKVYEIDTDNILQCSTSKTTAEICERVFTEECLDTNSQNSVENTPK